MYSVELEGDLWFYYRIDLRDLYRPRGGASRLTWRLLDVLITRLPGESATKTAIRDAMTDDQLAAAAKSTQQGYGPWSRSELLQADLIDLAKWTIYAIYASQGGKPKQPQPYPRPGVTPKKKTQALSAEGHAYLQRLRDNQGASPSPAAPDVPAIEPPGGVAEGA